MAKKIINKKMEKKKKKCWQKNKKKNKICLQQTQNMLV